MLKKQRERKNVRMLKSRRQRAQKSSIDVLHNGLWSLLPLFKLPDLRLPRFSRSPYGSKDTLSKHLFSSQLFVHNSDGKLRNNQSIDRPSMSGIIFINPQSGSSNPVSKGSQLSRMGKYDATLESPMKNVTFTTNKCLQVGLKLLVIIRCPASGDEAQWLCERRYSKNGARDSFNPDMGNDVGVSSNKTTVLSAVDLEIPALLPHWVFFLLVSSFSYFVASSVPCHFSSDVERCEQSEPGNKWKKTKAPMSLSNLLYRNFSRLRRRRPLTTMNNNLTAYNIIHGYPLSYRSAKLYDRLYSFHFCWMTLKHPFVFPTCLPQNGERVTSTCKPREDSVFFMCIVVAASVQQMNVVSPKGRNDGTSAVQSSLIESSNLESHFAGQRLSVRPT
ncbi:hypothetical protein M514_04883, partial [Trichuris suis]|uniref:Uncharacterized protein n=1 Tax=Trichuris suis TaxID=68888 RepID=A0A085MAU5_9BILA